MNKNIYNNHPIIPNSNQYFYEKKYISIHSEDRDYSKYPNSSEFELILPQDYLNVVSARLASWSFPSNYSVFSTSGAYNIKLTFKFVTLYNPGALLVSDPLLQGIFDALYFNLNRQYVISIQPGFYNPDQMSTELTNRMNEAVTIVISNFFNENKDTYAEALSLFKEYNRFNIVYDHVGIKLWFGNTADKFVLTNESGTILTNIYGQTLCSKSKLLPNFDSWGLPPYLGFDRCNAYAYSVEEYKNMGKIIGSTVDPAAYMKVPRFYYGDVDPGSGDNGYWLLPGAPNATVYFLEAPNKINFMGPDHIYMEIDGMNCIDETSPWNVSDYTLHTNQTNSIVRSAFAKIPVPATPVSQWFDRDSITYKYWHPPAERISKLKIKIRYHNGQIVSFGAFNFSFMIELNILNQQQDRSYTIKTS